MNILYRKRITIVSAVFIVVILSGCRKFIEVDPPFNSLNAANVFQEDATAIAVLTDFYAEMSDANNPRTNNPLRTNNISSISFYTGLSADELTLHHLNNQDLSEYYFNDLTVASLPVFWNSIYTSVFRVNNAIEGLNASTSLTAEVKKHLIGEAYFLRAFFYFYLVNLYGDVPLVLNADWKNNSIMPRTSKEHVYLQIIADLKEAQGKLNSQYLKPDIKTPYVTGAEERIRPNHWTATALLARVFLYTNDWLNAELEATKVINNTEGYSLVELSNVFIKNNKEVIWQLQPVGNLNFSNTGEGALFNLPASGPTTSNTYPVYLSKQVVNTFETDDLRKTNWVDSVMPATTAYYYPNKYKIGNVSAPTQEYPTIMRLAEQYLIRAEARAQLNNIVGAQSDLNTIRLRANLGQTPANDKTSLLTAILSERQVELFTEWGHRWFDLKRTNNINVVMSNITPQKANGAPWRPSQALYPIPQIDIDRNPSLVQNGGY